MSKLHTKSVLTVIVSSAAALGIGLAASSCSTEVGSTGEEKVARTSGAVEGVTRYIVKFKDYDKGKAHLDALGTPVFRDLKAHSAVAAQLTAAEVRVLEKHPAIDFIEEDAVRKPMAQTIPYGIPMVQADLASYSGVANRTVCIIDSGLYAAHEDHVGNLITGTNDPGGAGNWDTDNCGHGTHVAGTIAAVGNTVGVLGVFGNKNVKIHSVKVFGDDCKWAYSSDLVAALSVCQSVGANVVSMSLGGATKVTVEETAFANAYSAGLLSIAAAGNAGTTSGTVDPYSYPGSYDSVVSVAAVDSTEVVGTFSQENDHVELSAPGVGVLSTVSYLDTDTLTVGGTTYSGTFVTGATRTAGVTGGVVDGGLCDSVGAWTGKVVLCQRGTIAFAAKATNVVSGGGAAAVIYNNVAGALNATLNGTSTIPVIAITQTDGASALTHVNQSGTVLSQLTTPASGYASYDGTSMATPHVSGVAALVWSQVPTKTNAQIRAALVATAKHLGTAGRNISYGYGLVQAKAALDYLKQNGPSDAGVDSGGDSGAGVDAGVPVDAGVDSGVVVGVDAGRDSGVDSGIDSGVDSGIDSGVDAGVDAGVDSGGGGGVDSGGGGDVDSGGGGGDGGTKADAGVKKVDAGGAQDSGTGTDSGTGNNGSDDGGCGCRAAGTSSNTTSAAIATPGMLGGIFLLGLRLRRRRR